MFLCSIGDVLAGTAGSKGLFFSMKIGKLGYKHLL
jgi:hypothetical protein